MSSKTGSSKGKGKEIAKQGKEKGSKRPREDPKDPLRENLAACKVLATRYIDWPSMARLGLKPDMERLFTEMGVGGYMHRAEYTHVDETLQFLRSLAPPKEFDEFTFRIHGETYTLSTSDIRIIYGFRDMSSSQILDQTDMTQLWERMAADAYRMGKAKSSSIRNPTVKLLQRALGFSFFGRHEVAPIILDEWRMISAALRDVASRLDPPLMDLPRADPATIFIENLFRTQAQARRGKPQDWPLCIGGTLTPIFRHCGVQLSDPIRPIPLIDIQHLYSCRFLSAQRDSIFRYPFTWAGEQLELPLPFRERDLVSCSEPANLLFQHTPAHLGEYITSAYQAPGARTAAPRRSARYEREMTAIPQTPFEKEVAAQFSLLRRWNRWQDRTITKMAAHIRLLKDKLRCREGPAGASSSSTRQRSHSPESSNPSLELSPPPSDQESDA